MKAEFLLYRRKHKGKTKYYAKFYDEDKQTYTGHIAVETIKNSMVAETQGIPATNKAGADMSEKIFENN